MRDTAKRALGYGLSAVVGGALVYGGFVYEADPDLLTMLGSVEVQLTQAAMMTSQSEGDQDVARARTELLQQADAWLTRAEKAYPGSAWTAWYRGYMAYLNRDYLEAAKLYEGARFCDDCTDILRDKSLVNQALMLREAGRHAQAATLLRQHQDQFLDEHSEVVKQEIAAAEGAADATESPAEESAAARAEAAAQPAQ